MTDASIDLKSVAFAYGYQAPPVFSDVSLNIAQGARVVLVCTHHCCVCAEFSDTRVSAIRRSAPTVLVNQPCCASSPAAAGHRKARRTSLAAMHSSARRMLLKSTW